MTAPKLWPESLCRFYWEQTQRSPDVDRGGYREWSTGSGVVYTKTPKRGPICAACGTRLVNGVPALYVVDTDTRASGWTPDRRYLHLEPCQIQGGE